MVYDSGGKFDKGFNESAFNGMEQYKKESGKSYLEFEVQTDAQREQAIRRFAQKNADPIVTVGFAQGTALEKVAKEFPKTHFVIIDSVVALPNVQSIVFKEHEGSFLVGVLAAMASKTGKVGFVGGMDIPLIRRFECGYEQGVKYENKDATVFQNMTGTTGCRLERPDQGRRAREVAVRPGRRRGLRRGGCHQPRRLSGGQGTAASWRSASIPTRTTCIPAPC